MELNHTIVPANDKEASARFFAHIMGLAYGGPMGHFAPVQVNDALTMDFDNTKDFRSHHYAFKVSDEEFDGIFARIEEGGSSTDRGRSRGTTARSTPATADAASTGVTSTGT